MFLFRYTMNSRYCSGKWLQLYALELGSWTLALYVYCMWWIVLIPCSLSAPTMYWSEGQACKLIPTRNILHDLE